MKKGMWVAVLALLAALAAPAAAQEPKGIYLGGSGGYVLYDHSCENLIGPCDDDGYGPPSKLLNVSMFTVGILSSISLCSGKMYL